MNLIDILQELQIDFRRHGESPHVTEGWIGIDCNQCSRGEGKYKLGINLTSYGCSCWTCGRRGLAHALSETSGKPYHEIIQLLEGVERFHWKKQEPLARKLVLPKKLGILSTSHRQYLRRRGFDPDELVKLWSIQGIGLANKLCWRIWIPIHLDGQVVSWTARSTLPNPGIRYVNARPEEEAFPAKQLLYGEDYCRHAVIICEGPTDVWRIGPGAVCTFGVNVSAAQHHRLTKYPNRIVLFDNETEAQRRARKLADDLSVWPGVTHNVVLDAPDPGSADPREVRELRKKFLE